MQVNHKSLGAAFRGINVCVCVSVLNSSPSSVHTILSSNVASQSQLLKGLYCTPLNGLVNAPPPPLTHTQTHTYAHIYPSATKPLCQMEE